MDTPKRKKKKILDKLEKNGIIKAWSESSVPFVIPGTNK